MVGKKVLIIGIGNSAVDMAINLVNEGKYVNSSTIDMHYNTHSKLIYYV